MKKIVLLFVVCFVIIGNITIHAQGWQWMKGAHNGESHGEYVTTDLDGNVYTAGINFGNNHFGTYTTPAGGFVGNLVMAKYDSLGNIGWIKYYNSSIGSFPAGMVTDPFGNVYLLGVYRDSFFNFYGHTLLNPNWPPGYLYTFTGDSVNTACFFIAKINAGGNLIWVKNVGNVCSEWSDINNHMTIDQCGNIYIACPFWNDTAVIGGNSFTNAGSINFIVAKLDSSGTVLWAKNFGGNQHAWPAAIKVTPTGNIFITGTFLSDSIRFGTTVLTDTSSFYNWSIFIAKLDNSGTPIWAKTNKGPTATYVNAGGLAIDNQENAFVSGGYSIHHPSVPAGIMSIGSYVFPLTIPDSNYGFIAKFDSIGAISWAIETTNASTGAITIDACQNIWAFGELNVGVVGNDTIDGHVITAPPTSISPTYLAGWSATGAYLGTQVLPTGDAFNYDSYVTDITRDRGGHIYIVGTSLVNPFALAGDSLYNTASGYIRNMFIARYNPALGCPFETPPPCHLDSIAGGRRLCVGASTTLSEEEAGGRWSSSNSAVGAIDSVSGLLTAVLPGSVIITYSLAGSSIATTVTVSSTPPLPISGTSDLCPGATTTLSNAESSGIWSSSNSAIATIGSLNGIVTGIAPGYAIISYSFGTASCTVTKIITVEPSPEIFPVYGGGSYCAGGAGVHIGLGGSNTGIQYQLYLAGAAIGSPAAGTGSSLDFGLITLIGDYTVEATNISTTCTDNMAGSATITITPYDTAYAIYDTSFCAFSDADHIILSAPFVFGYWWYNGSTGPTDTVFTAGDYWIINKDTSTCTFNIDTFQVIFNQAPPPIIGTDTICAGNTISFIDAVAGGKWSSNLQGIATVDSSSGIVSGIIAGAATITYLLSTGCFVTKQVIVVAPPCVNGLTTITNIEDVVIVPNPATSELTVSTSNNRYNSLTITNNLGQELIQQPITTNQTTVIVNSLPPGIFYITLKGANGIKIEKFAKL